MKFYVRLKMQVNIINLLKEDETVAERFMEEDVKTRLILSGITELEEHGIKDFSLRRSAELAGVSCAAPYRYFKSKEEYIAKIFAYLASKWELLFNEISQALSGGGKRLVCELCIANIRFWLANRNLRSALLISGGTEYIKISDFDKSLTEAVDTYFIECGANGEEASERTNAVRAALYGYITLIGAGELPNTDESFELIKRELYKRFE